MLRVAITISAPYSVPASLDDFAQAGPDTLKKAREKGDLYALISCVSDTLAASPTGQELKLRAGQAAFLSADGTGWRLVATHPYDPAAVPEKWTTELSPGPFCR
jgi:mannose-6-phosphate isomerase class I